MFLSKIIIFLQTLNQNSPAAVNTNGNTKGQNAKDEEAWINPTTGEPRFPVSELARLEEMIGRTRWVVPVLPKCELEILMHLSTFVREDWTLEVKLASDSFKRA